jgi:hypothetical protein
MRARRSRALAGAVVATIAVLGTPTAGDAVGEVGSDAPTDRVAAGDVGPGYSPLPPARVLDTRAGATTVDGLAAGAGALGPASTREVQVTGRAGVPTSGVAAVVLNLTATGPTAPGFLTAFARGATRPNASALNFPPGKTVAGAVIVAVGTGGRVNIFNSAGSTHVIADVTGWVPTGAGYTGVVPARLLDTRPGATTVDGESEGGGSLGPVSTRDVTVTARGGVPASGVSAVALTVTVTEPTAAGFLTAHPTGTARPNASNLNFEPGKTVANLVVAKVGSGGRISLFNSAGRTHVIADVVGWFSPTGGFNPLEPARLADSRTSGATIDGQFKGLLPTLSNLDNYVTVTGRGGVPASGVGAVVLNVTVEKPNRAGFVTVYPVGGGLAPNASMLNYVPGETVPNLVIAKVGDQGRVAFTRAGGGALVVDVMGWLPTTAMGGVEDIAIGTQSGCVVVSGGQVRCWGYNAGSTSPMAAPVDQVRLSTVTQVTPGISVSCARRTTGALPCWGSGYLGGPTLGAPGSGLAGVVQADTNGQMTCAVLGSGQVRCWGNGILGNGTQAASFTPVTVTGITDAVEIAVGPEVACARRSGGTVVCWGQDNVGELGNGADTGARLTPVAVVGITDATQISLGTYTGCARLATGGARCWGLNSDGQAGDGTTQQVRAAPVDVAGLTGVVMVRTGGDHACAALTSGAVKCWGANSAGQIGDGSVTRRLTPVTAAGLTDIVQIDAHYRRTCARSSDGYAWCWGNGYLGNGLSGSAGASEVPVAVIN